MKEKISKTLTFGKAFNAPCYLTQLRNEETVKQTEQTKQAKQANRSPVKRNLNTVQLNVI